MPINITEYSTGILLDTVPATVEAWAQQLEETARLLRERNLLPLYIISTRVGLTIHPSATKKEDEPTIATSIMKKTRPSHEIRFEGL